MSSESLTFGADKRVFRELAKNLQTIFRSAGDIAISSSSWGTPLTILPICALLNATGKTVNIDSSNSAEFRSYLRTIGFPVGTASTSYCPDKSYLPITRTSLPEQSRNLNTIAGEYGKLVLSHAGTSERSDLVTTVDYIFGEMTTNVVEHSGAANYWLFAQKWRTEEIEFCIIDDGMGIRKRFQEEGMYFVNDIEAVREAIQGTSVKSLGSLNPSERGHGLGSSIKVMTGPELAGSFVLISGRAAYIKKSAQDAKIVEVPFDWPGVIIAGKLRFPNCDSDSKKRP
jgi:hypothetical protein